MKNLEVFIYTKKCNFGGCHLLHYSVYTLDWRTFRLPMKCIKMMSTVIVNVLYTCMNMDGCYRSASSHTVVNELVTNHE